MTSSEITEIKDLIYTIRGHRVMLDSDLAMMYEVPTKVLNQAVKRNITRFPNHYMFRLTEEEYNDLRSQYVTSNQGRGGRRYMPYVFTEQGIAMLSSVLNSEKAIQINIRIIDTFVHIRRWAIENKEIANRLFDLEQYFIQHCKDNNNNLKQIYEAINLLMDRTKPTKIGFVK